MASEIRNVFDDPFWADVRFAGVTIAAAGVLSVFSSAAKRFFFAQGWAVAIGVGSGEISTEVKYVSVAGRIVAVYPKVVGGALFTVAWFILFGAEPLGSGDEPQRPPDLNSGRLWLSTFLKEQFPAGFIVTSSEFGRLVFVMPNVWILDP